MYKFFKFDLKKIELLKMNPSYISVLREGSTEAILLI